MSCLSSSQTKEKAGTASPLQPTPAFINVGSKKRSQHEDPPDESPSHRSDKKMKLTEVELETIKVI